MMIKTGTFAILHFSVAFGVGYAMTGSALVGGTIAMVEPACNTVVFYFHEKAWQKFGRPSEQAKMSAQKQVVLDEHEWAFSQAA